MHDNPLNRRPSGSPPPSPSVAAQQAYQQQAYQQQAYQQAYQPPAFDYQPVPTYEADNEGSYGLGMVLGLLFTLIGYILVVIFGKTQTKRGALHGFLIRVGITVTMLLIAAAG